ncbi:MAG: peptidase S9, partial [Bacteroidota bacterium]
MPIDSAIVAVTGLSPDTLSARWHRTLRDELLPAVAGRTVPQPPRTEAELEAIAIERTERAAALAAGDRPRPPRFLAYPDSLDRLDAARLLARERETGSINIAPQLSPDGRYVAYLSELDLFGIDLFLADAESGEVLTKLQSVGSNPHFDALRFIESAGTWSPDGRRFAYVVFAGGDNEIAILDVDRRDVVERIKIEGIGAIKDPSWSPDGSQIAFAGVKGGITDLYTVEVGGADDGQVRQLTNDRFSDLQPAWSPDGSQIAFATDRGPTTDFVRLTFSPMQLALFDVASGQVETLDLFGNVKHINPAWSPDGASLFFLSDRSGFNDVYRLDVATGQTYRVTNLATGVAGIANLSPALSVADQTGALAYSVFEGQRYSVYRTEAADAMGEPVGRLTEAERTAHVLPPGNASSRSSVQGYVTDATGGLPEAEAFPVRGYRPKLSLDYISQPSVGVGYDPFFSSGFGISGGISFLFSDQLSDNVLGLAVAANGSLKDIGGQGLYLNRGNRLTYGTIVGHTPFVQVFVAPDPSDSYLTRYYYRTFVTQASGLASYPLNQSQRFEAQAGYRRFGYDLEFDEFVTDGVFVQFTGRREVEDFGQDALNLVEAGAAFVGDTSFQGFTSPIRGGRYRLGVDGTAGSLTFATLTADVRRYVMTRPSFLPRRVPVTLAGRVTHFGRYGADSESGRLQPLYLGFGQFVRGYTAGSFDTNDAFVGFQDRLLGSRIALASAEVRMPLLGVPQLGLLSFPYLPTELVFFADAGFAWGQVPYFLFLNQDGEEEALTYGNAFGDQTPIFSAGVSARVNLLGALILEPYYALPFSRWELDGDLPRGRGVFGLNIVPGW